MTMPMNSLFSLNRKQLLENPPLAGFLYKKIPAGVILRCLFLGAVNGEGEVQDPSLTARAPLGSWVAERVPAADPREGVLDAKLCRHDHDPDPDVVHLECPPKRPKHNIGILCGCQ